MSTENLTLITTWDQFWRDFWSQVGAQVEVKRHPKLIENSIENLMDFKAFRERAQELRYIAPVVVNCLSPGPIPVSYNVEVLTGERRKNSGCRRADTEDRMQES